jgi:pimeloyl-ACP methyl ester carboxylesterase
VVLCHGFPESSWSWRHQIVALAKAGYRVLAPDQRGYARSSRLATVEEYGISHLHKDLLALLDDVGRGEAVFVGHDWGALVTWEMARLHPDRTRAVVGVSVPFTDWPGRPTDLFRSIYGDSAFFYMLYFQTVGPAEKELEADVRTSMRRILWGGSGPAYSSEPRNFPAEGTGFLDMFAEPPGPLHEAAPWCTQTDLDVYTDQFEASGFFGPVSWYRNLDANYEVQHVIPAETISMPSYFIGGSRDGVIASRLDTLDAAHSRLPGYRGHTLIDGAGHWTQQEAPAEVNDALLKFLSNL